MPSSVKATIKNYKPRQVHPRRLYKANARSRVTNGRELLPYVDGRTVWVRRFRDLFTLHVCDLGGDANISEAERSLARRACALTVELERLEMLFAQAGEASSEQLDL